MSTISFKNSTVLFKYISVPLYDILIECFANCFFFMASHDFQEIPDYVFKIIKLCKQG